MLQYRLAAFFWINFFLIVSGSTVFCQNIDSIYALQQGPERTVTIGFRAWRLALNKQPEKLNALTRYVQQNGNAQEKLYLEEALAGIAQPAEATFEKILASNDYFIKKFTEAKDPFLIAYGYFTRAQRLEEKKYNNEALENFMYCYDALKKDPAKNFYRQGWWLHQIAGSYYSFKDYEKAVQIAKQADSHGGRFTPNDKWFELVSPNLVGMSFLNSGEYDSARVWLLKTYERAKQQGSIPWIGIAGGNIGNTYYLQKKYAEAAPYFAAGLDTCVKLQIWDNVSPFASNLADCYMHTGQISNVPELLQLARHAAEKDSSNVNWHKYYLAAADYYKLKGDSKQAFTCDDAANAYQQKLTASYDVTKKVRTEAGWAYQKKQLESELAFQKIKKEKLLLYGLIVGACLLLIIGILYFKRQKVKHLLKHEKLENEKLKAEEELHIALREIKDFTWHILEKNKMIEIYAAEIEKLKKQNDTITNEQLHSLESLRNSTVLTDTEWTSFKTMFEKVHPGYLKRLKLNYPDLTPAETRYLVFTKLNITSKEMAAMLGVSAEAVRNIRFRLKKKLNVEDSNELERMANEV